MLSHALKEFQLQPPKPAELGRFDAGTGQADCKANNPQREVPFSPTPKGRGEKGTSCARTFACNQPAPSRWESNPDAAFAPVYVAKPRDPVLHTEERETPIVCALVRLAQADHVLEAGLTHDIAYQSIVCKVRCA